MPAGQWLNLVLAVLNIGFMLYGATTAFRQRLYAATAIPLIYVPIETSAQYLLFLAPGKYWFERKEPAVAA